MLLKIAQAKYKYTLDSSTNTSNNVQIATSGGHEIVAIIVTGGTADIVASVHDSPAGPGDPKETIWIGANQGESMDFDPAQAIPMKKGIYLQIEQGGNPFNGKLTILYN